MTFAHFTQRKDLFTLWQTQRAILPHRKLPQWLLMMQKTKLKRAMSEHLKLSRATGRDQQRSSQISQGLRQYLCSLKVRLSPQIGCLHFQPKRIPTLNSTSKAKKMGRRGYSLATVFCRHRHHKSLRRSWTALQLRKFLQHTLRLQLPERLQVKKNCLHSRVVAYSVLQIPIQAKIRRPHSSNKENSICLKK